MREWNSKSASLLHSLKQDSAFSIDFATNSKECVQGEDESFFKSVFKQGTDKEQKVLGMFWNPNQDELIYHLTKILEGVKVQPATRRLIVTTPTRFFDPLGLISLVILPFKIMFQKLCKAKRDWDELVDTELNQEWFSTLSDLRLAGRVSFQRCYDEGLGGNEVKSLQLQCFADTLGKAYGAVVYMRVECEIAALKLESLRWISKRYRVLNSCLTLLRQDW